jgi:hypothetical protein
MSTKKHPGIRDKFTCRFPIPFHQSLVLVLTLLLSGITFSTSNAASRSTVNTAPTYSTISNGTFETPVLAANSFAYAPSGAGWTFSGGSGIAKNGSGFTSGNPNAPQGTQVLFLQGTGSTSRANGLSNGTYRLQLRAAQRANWQASSQTFAVLLGADTIAIIKPTSTSYGTYYTGAFKITSSTTTLKLVGLNPNGGDNTAFVDYIRAEQLKPWSSGSTWVGGTVPGSTDDVTITAAAGVVLDQDVTVATLTINGQFYASSNQDLTLSAKRILATGSGRFEWGKAEAPYYRRGIVNLTGTDPNDSIVGPGAKFLAANGSATLEMRGAPLVSWTRLAANSSGNTLVLQDKVNWRVNDKIVVTSSRLQETEAEERTITAISGDGKTLTLNSNLTYPHKGSTQTWTKSGTTWTLEVRAEVGLLTRNLTVQGQSPGSSGFGGHMMIMANAKGYVDGIELFQMGQRGKLARYPFHWHMQEAGGAGQFIKNSSIHHSFNRVVTIHGTYSTLVENNFAYDHIGHGIFMEDGSERYNVIRKNVVCLTKLPTPSEALTPSEKFTFQVQNKTPASFWITNPNNTLEDNIAAGNNGTGFWFAMPSSPMGLSANDPRFAGMQPYKLPLISFKRNTAHSCGTGFDVFDKLSASHDILPNGAWDITSATYIEDCHWYANFLGLYTGIGNRTLSHNLIFKNNTIVENQTGTMFASYSVIDNSAIVAKTGLDLMGATATRWAYRVYDGAGQVKNSYFVGWNDPNFNLFRVTGAGTKHVNHLFTNNTTDHAGTPRIVLQNYDLPPKANTGANDPEHPRLWSHVIRDVTGGISGVANTNIVGNHPFQLVGDETTISNWTYALRSTHRFALSRLNYDGSPSNFPNVVVTRSKAGTPTEKVYYIDGFKEHHQLPFIVNEGFEYLHEYEALPPNKLVRINMEDATSGDYYVARFKDFGKFGGLNVTSPQMSVVSKTSLSALNSSTTAAWYKQSGGDLWVKTRAVARDQIFNITWTSNATLSSIDSDGDEQEDGTEVLGGRDPFWAGDLAAEFNTTGDFEHWTGFANVTGQAVSGGVMKGTASNNGDAWVVNNAFDFDASKVSQIQVRMKASRNTTAQIFFATNTLPGFSGTRVVSASYTGNGGFQTLTLNVGGHASWNGTITDLRLDPVSGLGIYFEVDWMRAIGVPKTIANNEAEPGTEWSLESTGDIRVYPNPMQNLINIDLQEAGVYQTVRLIDLQGRILREMNLKPYETHLEMDFEGKPLVAGVYLIQLLGEQGSRQVKVLKM